MNPSASPSVAIVLLNWNSRLDTLECLESVFRLWYENFRVVLCDNASSDGTIEAVEQWAAGTADIRPASSHYADMFAGLRTGPIGFVWYDRQAADAADPNNHSPGEMLSVISTGGNLGFAGGNNVGIRFALRNLAADYVWLLNTDTIVHPAALTTLVARAQRDPGIGMVGSSLVYYWRPDTVQALGGSHLKKRNTLMSHLGDGTPVAAIPHDGRDIEQQMAYVVGASMLVSRSFIEQVGLMNESYFLYYEEIDWISRAAGRFSLGYAPASIVYHKVGGASRKVASIAAERFMWRNRIKFVARFMPGSLRGTLANMAFEMFRAFMKGQFALASVIGSALLDHKQLREEGARMDIGARLA